MKNNKNKSKKKTPSDNTNTPEKKRKALLAALTELNTSEEFGQNKDEHVAATSDHEHPTGQKPEQHSSATTIRTVRDTSYFRDFQKVNKTVS